VRNYRYTELLSRAASADSSITGVEDAWIAAAGDVVAGTNANDFRRDLLGRIIDILDRRNLLDQVEPDPPPGPSFVGDNDRWAGWWAEDPIVWPASMQFDLSEIVTAIRRVPLGLRVMLVLRDAAGLDDMGVNSIVHGVEGRQAALLDVAREQYVAGLDAIVQRTTAGVQADSLRIPKDRLNRKHPVGITASDVSCEVISGLVGRWQDGDMSDHDRDAFEQHLLFCPPCLIQIDRMRIGLAVLASVSPMPNANLRQRLHRLLVRG
jgi:hypothetical protein